MQDDDTTKPFIVRLDRLRSKADKIQQQAADIGDRAGYIQSATDQFVKGWTAIDSEAELDQSVSP